MTLMTKTNHTEGRTNILRELDELINYIDQDDQQPADEKLVDPAFFIGTMDKANDMSDNYPDVPTLTTVSDKPVEQAPENGDRQPGLFSARVARIKQNQDAEPAIETEQLNSQEPDAEGNREPDEKVSESDIEQMVESLVEESLPMLEALLRTRLKNYLQQQQQK